MIVEDCSQPVINQFDWQYFLELQHFLANSITVFVAIMVWIKVINSSVRDKENHFGDSIISHRYNSNFTSDH